MLIVRLWFLLLGCQARLLGDPLLAKIEKNNDSHFLNMPNEVMWMIMQNVDYFSLLKLAVVSNQFEVWVELFRNLFPRQALDIQSKRKMINAIKGTNLSDLINCLGTSVYDLEFPPIQSGIQENSILVRAVKLGNIEIVKRLVKHGAKVTLHAIEAALINKKLDILLFLLRIERAYAKRYDCKPLLMRACREHWSLQELRTMLSSEIIKEGLEARDFLNRTPLHFSIEISPMAVRLLLEAGADITALDGLNQNVLHRVIQTVLEPSSRLQLIDVLVEHGLDMNQQDWEGNTPLHIEVKRFDRQSLDVVRKLVKAGADPNLQNKKGLTPISIIRYRRGPEFLEIMTKEVNRA